MQPLDGLNLVCGDRVRDDESARRGFMALASEVFGLDFMPWHAGGWWGGDYIPHTLFDGDRAVANVSVNRINTRHRGAARNFLQIGTVMTDPEYRGRGLAKRLMAHVVGRYRDECDGIYLYANDTVLDFYPKFGFVPATEYDYSLEIAPSTAPVRILDMGDPRDRALLLDRYLARCNPYSALPMEGNAGLIMFYCAQFLARCVYEIPGLDAVAVAESSGGAMLVYDVFGGSAPLVEILSALAGKTAKACTLGFSPLDAGAFHVAERREADTTLFILGEALARLEMDRLAFPRLSHA